MVGASEEEVENVPKKEKKNKKILAVRQTDRRTDRRRNRTCDQKLIRIQLQIK